MNHNTKHTRFGNPPQFSRLRKLESSTLRTQEQHDPPTELGLAALKRHAEYAASNDGKVLAFKMRSRRSSFNLSEKGRAA